jgi:hypothetical protein
MWRDHTILVAPVDGGWSVHCDEGLQPLMFLSGARAEEQARALARCLARGGEDAQVVVHDRASTLVGSTRYRGAKSAAA